MKNLEEIRASVADELKRLNAIIKSTLNSDTELMNKIVERYLQTKGKQLRPLLVLLSGKLFGGITEKVLYAGAAIEMLHNASLIHDDVIDEAQQRRSVETINCVWSNHVAVLVGDFFVTGALRCAVKTGDSRILDSLASMGGDLSLGEIAQYDNARTRNIDEQTYLTIIGKKTASLFESCVTVGGYATDAPEDKLLALRNYARLLGLCFQIKDDTFDYFHDPAVGKPTGNDLREGKITLPLIYALGRTDLPEHAEIQALVHKEQLSTTDIERLVEYAKQAGGIDYAYDKMEQLRAEADAMLDSHFESSDAIDAFKQIFHYIIQRKL
ncbi:MAG: polyprenyl synthetase family protein [Muribaculaceae bacterium]|nr:polyprenyl synthetase family protein [Muribaculaceae bacterium]